MSKRKWVWVTRDNDGDNQFCVIWDGAKKPLWNGAVWNRKFRLRLIVICADFLAKHTGVKIKPGECVKVEFSGKIVEGK